VSREHAELSYGFKTPHDLWAKLKRDAKRVEAAKDDDIEYQDQAFNFLLTANSLRDWILKYSFTPQDLCEIREFEKLPLCLRICRDLANSSKHFEFNKLGKKGKVVEKVVSQTVGVIKTYAGLITDTREYDIFISADGDYTAFEGLAKDILGFYEKAFRSIPASVSEKN